MSGANEAATRAGESNFEIDAGSWIGATRILVGFLLLYEIAFGGWHKLNGDWIGFGAGTPLADRAGRAVSDGTYIWYSAVLEAVVIPHAWFWSNLAVVLQLTFGIALLVGFWARPAAIVGLLYFLPVFNMGTIRTSPTFGVAIAFLLVANAGYHYGLDGWIDRRSGTWARRSDRIASFGSIPRSWYPTVAATFALVGLYYLLTIPERGYAFADGLALVGVELAMLSAIVAGGFTLAYHGADSTPLAADALRIFVGYRLLHEVFVRIEPGVNTLPGGAPLELQAALFSDIAAAHVTPVSVFIESVILPALPVWAVVFAVVQIGAGIALFVGYRTRLFGSLAVAYLSVLIALGFVRLAPLLLMSAIAAAALGGRYAGLDAIYDHSKTPPRATLSELSAPRSAAYTLGVVAAGFVALGLVLGIEPGGYGVTTGAISLVMIGFALVVLIIGTRGFEPPRRASASDD
ncbi:MAG: DoxX family membrane protein [Natronomonas sp.]